MSFGLRDKTWIEPDDDDPRICANCDHWRECPRNYDTGYCVEIDDDTECHETCVNFSG